MKPHKHRDVIIAWANGEEIEFRNSAFSMKWETIKFPAWSEKMEYRVKPKEEVLRFRVALMHDTHMYFTNTADNAVQEEILQKDPMFIKWLGGWRTFKQEARN